MLGFYGIACCLILVPLFELNQSQGQVSIFVKHVSYERRLKRTAHQAYHLCYFYSADSF